VTLARIVDPPARVERGSARGWIDLLAPAAEVAKTIAPTEFVPRALRHNVPAVTAAILYGDEVGLGPLASVNEIHVIEGRIFVGAEAQRALVLAAGHEIWPDELGTSRATWCGRRRGSEQVTRVTWTLDDARRANLVGKPNWRSYPRPMLSARASAELVRAVFADVVHGLGALEEYDGDTFDGGADRGGNAPARPRATRRRRPAVAAAAEPETRDVEAPLAAPLLPPLPGETQADDEQPAAPELLTAGQLRRLQQLMRERGIGSRSDRLMLAVEIIGRTISTSKELTTVEADRVISYLEQLDEPPAEREYVLPTRDPEPADDDEPEQGGDA
jgi:hypothetical protein